MDVEYIRLDFGFVILPIMVDCSELFYLVPGNYWLWAKKFGEVGGILKPGNWDFIGHEKSLETYTQKKKVRVRVRREYQKKNSPAMACDVNRYLDLLLPDKSTEKSP